MKLSTKARYGLYAAIQLAKHYENGYTRVSEISRAINVTDGYLEQILAFLRRDGIIVSQRGAYGGYRLYKSPECITVGEILRSVEDNLTIVDCLAGRCTNSDICISHDLWNNLYKTINDYLDGITLTQLLNDSQKNQSEYCRCSAETENKND